MTRRRQNAVRGGGTRSRAVQKRWQCPRTTNWAHNGPCSAKKVSRAATRGGPGLGSVGTVPAAARSMSRSTACSSAAAALAVSVAIPVAVAATATIQRRVCKRSAQSHTPGRTAAIAGPMEGVAAVVAPEYRHIDYERKKWKDVDWDSVLDGAITAPYYYMRSGLVRKDCACDCFSFAYTGAARETAALPCGSTQCSPFMREDTALILRS